MNVIFRFIQNFAAADCGSSFFGFPTWYKFLGAAGKLDEECSINDTFELMDIWWIVLAVTEMAIYLVGILSVVMIIWGGFRMIISQGSPDSIKAGRDTVLYAIIGLVISISARVLISVVNGIFN